MFTLPFLQIATIRFPNLWRMYDNVTYEVQLCDIKCIEAARENSQVGQDWHIDINFLRSILCC